MRKYLFIIFMVVLVCAAPVLAETYTVKKVLEGDLIELSNGKKVRLIGLDAPDSRETERAKMFAERSGKKMSEVLSVGKRSKKFLEDLLAGKTVRLEYDLAPTDSDANILAYVYELVCTGKCKMEAVIGQEYVQLDDGMYLFINATIIKSGYASPLILPPNVKHSRLLKDLFLEAQENKRGLWDRKK